MKTIEALLKDKAIESKNYKVLSNKDGVLVLELSDVKDQPILKYFFNKLYTREIEYYKLLNHLDVKTMDVKKYYEDAMLLENINLSGTYALTQKTDLENKDLLRALAKWYKKFHRKGRQYVLDHSQCDFYSEIELLNDGNIKLLKNKTAYENHEFWPLLDEKLKGVLTYYHKHKTLTYNDFSHTNMVHSLKHQEAYMFDYNFLGLGLPYFDISNVLSALKPEFHEVFIEAYGGFDSLEKEINDVMSHLIGLIIAYEKEVFPKWGVCSLEFLTSGELLDKLRRLKL